MWRQTDTEIGMMQPQAKECWQPPEMERSKEQILLQRLEGVQPCWRLDLSMCAKSLDHDPMDCSPPGSSVHGDSPGKNTGVGCHALLQGSSQRRDRTCISYLLHGQVVLYHCRCLRSLYFHIVVLVSDLWPPELWKNRFSWSHHIYGTFLQQLQEKLKQM